MNQQRRAWLVVDKSMMAILMSQGSSGIVEFNARGVCWFFQMICVGCCLESNEPTTMPFEYNSRVLDLDSLFLQSWIGSLQLRIDVMIQASHSSEIEVSLFPVIMAIQQGWWRNQSSRNKNRKVHWTKRQHDLLEKFCCFLTCAFSNFSDIAQI